MMTHDEMIAVIAAHKAGCKIQFRPDFRPVVDWNDCVLRPVWNFSMYEYRIKPKDFYVDATTSVCEAPNVGRVFEPADRKSVAIVEVQPNFEAARKNVSRPIDGLPTKTFAPSGLPFPITYSATRGAMFFEAFVPGSFRPFQPGGKFGVTPNARAEWTLQTMGLEDAPKCPIHSCRARYVSSETKRELLKNVFAPSVYVGRKGRLNRTKRVFQMNQFKVNDRREWYRNVYLKSEHWANLKAMKWQRCNGSCGGCGGRATDVHHLNYRNIFDVKMGDLMLMCRPCHEKWHSLEGLGLFNFPVGTPDATVTKVCLRAIRGEGKTIKRLKMRAFQLKRRQKFNVRSALISQHPKLYLHLKRKRDENNLIR